MKPWSDMSHAKWSIKETTRNLVTNTPWGEKNCFEYNKELIHPHNNLFPNYLYLRPLKEVRAHCLCASWLNMHVFHMPQCHITLFRALASKGRNLCKSSSNCRVRKTSHSLSLLSACSLKTNCDPLFLPGTSRFWFSHVNRKKNATKLFLYNSCKA